MIFYCKFSNLIFRKLCWSIHYTATSLHSNKRRSFLGSWPKEVSGMITTERHRAVVIALQPISGVTEDCWIFRVGVSAILVISNSVLIFVLVVSAGSKVIDWFLTGSSPLPPYTPKLFGWSAGHLAVSVGRSHDIYHVAQISAIGSKRHWLDSENIKRSKSSLYGEKYGVSLMEKGN